LSSFLISPTVAGSRVDNDGACREAMLGDAADVRLYVCYFDAKYLGNLPI